MTIDAAGCQIDIGSKIRSGGSNYMIALKGNQGALGVQFFTQAREAGYEDADCRTSSSGEIEERGGAVMTQLDWLECREKWKDLQSLIEITLHRTIQGKRAEEGRLYISSLALTGVEAGKIVRSHWTIETRLHWNMDVNVCEDAHLATSDKTAENLAALKTHLTHAP